MLTLGLESVRCASKPRTRSDVRSTSREQQHKKNPRPHAQFHVQKLAQGNLAKSRATPPYNTTIVSGNPNECGLQRRVQLDSDIGW